ncbi:hypothetical protein [Mucilaginibacter celer]|uniref:Uncharacterized protein n=1 Tax=Mucilaginibacter celer TaxID=2305508 RepID=A0A494W430_9SPHI|nr:hypothetical protein [Mucilaginibacter celer]AYL98265.1 hypothetical protein HYN43_024590 [Mucilaginibacter celer]
MKFFYLTAIIFCFCCCSPNGNFSADRVTPEKNNIAINQAPAFGRIGWVYSHNNPEKIYSANIIADNLLQFDFPHNGGSTVTLSIDKTKRKNRALINISKGQFGAGIDGSSITIGFDNEQPMAFKASSVSDEGAAVIAIDDADRLIKNLRSARKMTVQADFYDAGEREMNFEVAGFKWDN